MREPVLTPRPSSVFLHVGSPIKATGRNAADAPKIKIAARIHAITGNLTCGGEKNMINPNVTKRAP